MIGIAELSGRRRRRFAAASAAADNGIAALVAAQGGSSVWTQFYDRRVNVTTSGGVVDQWDDALGRGFPLTAATTQRPAYTSNVIVLDGVDDRLASDGTGFALDADQTIWLIAQRTGGHASGYPISICDDLAPTRQLAVFRKSATNTYSGQKVAAGTNTTSDTTTLTDATIRLIRSTQTTTNQTTQVPHGTAATIANAGVAAATANILCVGDYYPAGGFYWGGNVYACGVVAGAWTQAYTDALMIWAAAQHAAVAETGVSADITQLITDLGGDANVYGIYDVRHNLTHVATLVSAWGDARGPGYGPDLAQATGSKQPVWDGTSVNPDGVDDELLSAALAALSLDTSRSLALIGAVNSSANARYCWSITNAGRTRYIGIYGGTTNAFARHTDSAGNNDGNTGKAKGTTLRTTTTQQQAGTRAMTTKMYAGSSIANTPTGTVAAEDKILCFGGLNGLANSYGSPKAVALIVSAAGVFWTTGQRDIIRAWGLTRGATDA